MYTKTVFDRDMKKFVPKNLQRIGFIIAVLLVVGAGVISSGIFGLSWDQLQTNFKFNFPAWNSSSMLKPDEKVRVVSEESIVIDVAEKVSPSVVTVGISKTARVGNLFEIDPYDPFSVFGMPRIPQQEQKIEQDIGSGFILKEDGFIVTNKHVVDDAQATYKVITKDDKTYEVEKIYRDPSNDLAILKINATGLPAIEMGDSSNLKVGQFVIAIGTALGEFRHTVTTGVISGLGRGISAGSPFEGFVEQLDNVIQTDAAINPGNSGGPLLNSGGQVIGVNTAVAQGGQNIGFAMPINVVKEMFANFNSTGQFSRPYIGVKYKMIGRDLAILNDVPQGAFVVEVVDGSPAAKAGIEAQDILMTADGQKIDEESGGLSKVISTKKVGDSIMLKVWRNGETRDIKVTLGEFSG